VLQKALPSFSESGIHYVETAKYKNKSKSLFIE